MMVDEQRIQQVVQRIVAEAQPLRVILFGSYGRGDADADSDLDIMVIEQQVDNRGEEMMRLRKAVGSIGVGVDVWSAFRPGLKDKSTSSATIDC
jgi:predicted nucleotidyltransferase